MEPWKANLEPSKLTRSSRGWLWVVQVVTGNSQEEVMIFVTHRQTDTHHNIYIIIRIIIVIVIITSTTVFILSSFALAKPILWAPTSFCQWSYHLPSRLSSIAANPPFITDNSIIGIITIATIFLLLSKTNSCDQNRWDHHQHYCHWLSIDYHHLRFQTFHNCCSFLQPSCHPSHNHASQAMPCKLSQLPI